jgi:opacity protein-like surface antigen
MKRNLLMTLLIAGMVLPLVARESGSNSSIKSNVPSNMRTTPLDEAPVVTPEPREFKGKVPAHLRGSNKEQSGKPGYYFRADAGLALVGDSKGEEITGTDFIGGDDHIVFREGIRFGVAPGVNLTEWLGLELETGVIYNELDSVNISSGTGSFKEIALGNGSHKAMGDFIQVPMIANAVFRWPGGGKFKPFVGVGAGGVFERLTVKKIGTNVGTYSEGNFAMGQQLFAGVTWDLPFGDLLVGYKLMNAWNPSADGDFPSVLTHTLQVGLQVHF